MFGIETEFGVTCAFEGQRKLSPDEVARYLFREVMSWGDPATCSCGTVPACTWMWVRIRSTRPLSVTTSASWWSMTGPGGILEGLLVDAERRLGRLRRGPPMPNRGFRRGAPPA
jgi:proteasome accessory factor A